MSEEIKDEKKTTTKKSVSHADGERKVAPSIVVSSPNRRSIDQVIADNPNKTFVHAPLTTASALRSQGLIPVVGENGRPLKVGNKIICEDVGMERARQIAEAHKAATERINDVKDPKQNHSADVTARRKKPTS